MKKSAFFIAFALHFSPQSMLQQMPFSVNIVLHHATEEEGDIVFKRLLNEKRYLKVIYLWISLLVAALLLFFSLTVYLRSSQTIMDSTYEMNRQIFAEIQYGIEQTDENVRNICAALYVNPVVSRMMYQRLDENEIYDWILDFQKLYNPFMISNSAIHSIYIYNPVMGQYFSSYRHLYYQDTYLDVLFSQGEMPPTLVPISRAIEVPGERRETRVITYILYEDIRPDGKPDGALVVNIKTDWMEENIRKLGSFDEGEQSNILIFDGSGNWVVDTMRLPDVSNAASLEFCLEQMQRNQDSGFFMETGRLESSEYAVFHNRTENWNIIKVQSLSDVFRYVNEIRISILIITPLFCLLFLLAAYYLSSRIYRPIDSLVNKVRAKSIMAGEQEGNEITLLNRAYDSLLSKAALSSDEKSSSIITAYHLQNLLIDSEHADIEKLREMSGEFRQLCEMNGPWLICLLSVDSYYAFCDEYSRQDQELIQRAMTDIEQELLGQHYLSIGLSLGSGIHALLLRLEMEDEGKYGHVLQEVFPQAALYLQEHFFLSFSVSVSSCVPEIRQLTKAYHAARNNLTYRFIFGKGAVITPELVESNNSSAQTGIEEQVLTALVSHLEDRNSPLVKEDLDTIRKQICMQNHSRLTPTLMSFVLFAIDAAIRVEPAIREREDIQIAELYHSFTRMETCDEIFNHLFRLLSATAGEQPAAEHKRSMLINAIKEIIEKEYANPYLSLQEIADRFSLSPQYLGRLFRDGTGLSVADYINEVRMKNAARILKSGSFRVQDVKDMVGIDSDSQFYRLFKKKYGITPKQYMLQNTMQRK